MIFNSMGNLLNKLEIVPACGADVHPVLQRYHMPASILGAWITQYRIRRGKLTADKLKMASISSSKETPQTTPQPFSISNRSKNNIQSMSRQRRTHLRLARQILLTLYACIILKAHEGVVSKVTWR